MNMEINTSEALRHLGDMWQFLVIRMGYSPTEKEFDERRTACRRWSEIEKVCVSSKIARVTKHE